MQDYNDLQAIGPPDVLAGTMTEAELAALIDVDRRTVRRWRSEGVLPFSPLPLPGRLIRFWRSDVAAWLGRAL